MLSVIVGIFMNLFIHIQKRIGRFQSLKSVKKVSFRRKTLVMGMCFILAVPCFSYGEEKFEKNDVDRLDRLLMKKTRLFGLKVDLNATSLSQHKDDRLIRDLGLGTGVGIGATLDGAFTRFIGYRVEALYRNKNFTHKSPVAYDLNGGVTPVESETYLDYLELPLLALVRFNPGHMIRPYATLGIYGSILINADGIQGVQDNPQARLPFNTFDAGFIIGGGSYFVLPKGLGILSAELRYTSSAMNLADVDLEVVQFKPLENALYELGDLSLNITYFF